MYFCTINIHNITHTSETVRVLSEPNYMFKMGFCVGTLYRVPA